MNDTQTLFGRAPQFGRSRGLHRDRGPWSATARTANCAASTSLAFAAKHGFNEGKKVISAFLPRRTARPVRDELERAVPGLRRGVLDSSLQLKSVHKEAYDCALCSKAYEPTSRRDGRGGLHREPRACGGLRAHDPHTPAAAGILPPDLLGHGNRPAPKPVSKQYWKRYRSIRSNWAPGEKGQISVQLPARVRDHFRTGDAMRRISSTSRASRPRSARRSR